jgi:hypothetical protein
MELTTEELTAEAILSFKTSDGTKSGYTSKINYIKNFLSDNFPQFVADNKIVVPLSYDAITHLFVKLSTDTNLPKKKKKKKAGQSEQQYEDENHENNQTVC